MASSLSQGTVPKMGIQQYLTLVQPIRKLKRFRLVNQEIKGGLVYFSDVASMKRLNEIIRFHNDGERPIEYIIDKEGKKVRHDSTVNKDTPNIFEYQDCLESVKGPDSQGWYTARCPVCEFKGAEVGQVWDDTHDHFRFREGGAFYCHANCEAPEVFTWLTAMLEGRMPVFGKTTGTAPTVNENEFDEWLAKKGGE